MKNPKKVLQGKKNRRKGKDFELVVRKDLESRGMIVSRWLNQVDLEKEKIIPAKYNKFNWGSSGFPDLVAFNKTKHYFYQVFLIECKINGNISKTEKEKLLKLTEMGLECYIASKAGTKVSYSRIRHQKASKDVWESISSLSEV